MEIIAGESPEQHIGIPHPVFQQSVIRCEFPSSRNGSIATLLTRLDDCSSGLRSDSGVVLRSSYVCLMSSWFMHVYDMCICSGFRFDAGQARCSICDYVICSCLCYVQFIPDFGPMLGMARCSGRGRINAKLRYDVGQGPMQGARPIMFYMCYCMVCGSLGDLTKLHAYSFQFGFRYFN